MPAPYEELRQKHVAEFVSRLPAFVAQLDWSVSQLRADRERRLRALVQIAKERSPWHRERLRGIDPNALVEDDLQNLPTMTKADLMSNWDDIVTDRRLSLKMVEEHLMRLTGDAYLLDEFHAVASSGSSGLRGVFVYDWEGWVSHAMFAFRRNLRLAAKRGPGSPVISAAVAAERSTHVSSAIAETFSNPSMRVHRVPVTLPVDEIVARLNDIQPTSLVGYPSMLHILAERARTGQLRIHPFRVVSSAEPLLPETRRALEEVWGVYVDNGYAASEAVLAGTCERGGCHLVDDAIYFEPVDASGATVPPGVTSAKVLLTNLYNVVLPLIRYELTDEVTLLDGSCECGSTFRRIGDVHGRMDDIFIYEGGVAVHPHIFRSALAQQRTVIGYQVLQTERGADVLVQLIGDPRLDELRSEIETSLRRVGVDDPRVRVMPVHTLDRGATGKLKRFVPLPGSIGAGGITPGRQ